MTISATAAMAPGDLLERTRELYRDLTVGLQRRIAQINGLTDTEADCKDHVEAVKAHHKALQSVLDLEANLEKRSKHWNGGASCELDLHTARDEVLARFALWSARK